MAGQKVKWKRTGGGRVAGLHYIGGFLTLDFGLTIKATLCLLGGFSGAQGPLDGEVTRSKNNTEKVYLTCRELGKDVVQVR